MNKNNGGWGTVVSERGVLLGTYRNARAGECGVVVVKLAAGPRKGESFAASSAAHAAELAASLSY